jgi:hypothetical protein
MKLFSPRIIFHSCPFTIECAALSSTLYKGNAAAKPAAISLK